MRCYEVAGAQTPLLYIENDLFRPCLLVRVLKAVASFSRLLNRYMSKQRVFRDLNTRF